VKIIAGHSNDSHKVQSEVLNILPIVSLTDEFLPNIDLKNMISTYTKNFLWEKNGSNSPDF
jgi:hypothetical protein